VPQSFGSGQVAGGITVEPSGQVEGNESTQEVPFQNLGEAQTKQVNGLVPEIVTGDGSEEEESKPTTKEAEQLEPLKQYILPKRESLTAIGKP
jgi:hypothetical protein